MKTLYLTQNIQATEPLLCGADCVAPGMRLHPAWFFKD